jgi:hypothetical protein
MSKPSMKDMKKAMAEENPQNTKANPQIVVGEDPSEIEKRSQAGGAAILAGHKAARLRRSGSALGVYKAEAQEQIAQTATNPEVVQVAGGEVIRDADSFPIGLRNTLEEPTVLAADASEHRSRLAAEADVLEMAIDASMSIEAKNSLEKMAAHQMALAHKMAMNHGALALTETNPMVRTSYLRASAAAMRSFQQGVDCFHRGRRGGKQFVTVQRVNVNEGGQAIVAGNMQGPSK